ncbi:hypothetical protein [Nocardioides humi]|uniref:Uncharacterized protein n=1 Tax=Nocardioides humi TaxID=449461 RepID=A0ABN2AZE7_9ACTN|nr:hypothetical protein [Nocardioides humi]
MTSAPRTVARLLVALACATGLVLTAPALASAADLVHVDPARDVVGGRLDSDTDRVTPSERGVDIRRVRISHGTDALVIRFRTRGPLPRKKFFLGATVRTPAGTFDVTYTKMFGAVYEMVTQDDQDIACTGFTTSLERKAVTFVVPTACLGTPPWVRVGVGAGVIRGKRLFADDGLRRGIDDEKLRLSRRIARG